MVYDRRILFVKTRLTIQLFLAIVVTTIGFAGSGPDPEKDPQMNQLLQESVNLIKNKNSAEAIPKCEIVINAYRTHYEGDKNEREISFSGLNNDFIPWLLSLKIPPDQNEPYCWQIDVRAELDTQPEYHNASNHSPEAETKRG